ncbi:MAG: hypothetical protein NZ789_13560, partial [Pseudomonadales bacterium]|nr:hypothetical protein [Pseudomonadales bacterium]
MRLEVLPACTWCGKPTGGWCDYCSQGPQKAVCSDCGGTDGTNMVSCYDCTRKRALLHGYDCIDHKKEYSDSEDDDAEVDLVGGLAQVIGMDLANEVNLSDQSTTASSSQHMQTFMIGSQEHDPLANAWPHAVPRVSAREVQQQSAWADYRPTSKVMSSADRWAAQQGPATAERWVKHSDATQAEKRARQSEATPALAVPKDLPSMVPHTTAWQRGAAAAGATPYNPQVGQQLTNNSYHEMMMAHSTGPAPFPGESLPGAPGGMNGAYAQHQTAPITQQQLCSAQPDYVYPTTRQAWVSSATPATIGGRTPFVPAMSGSQAISESRTLHR